MPVENIQRNPPFSHKFATRLISKVHLAVAALALFAEPMTAVLADHGELTSSLPAFATFQ